MNMFAAHTERVEGLPTELCSNAVDRLSPSYDTFNGSGEPLVMSSTPYNIAIRLPDKYAAVSILDPARFSVERLLPRVAFCAKTSI